MEKETTSGCEWCDRKVRRRKFGNRFYHLPPGATDWVVCTRKITSQEPDHDLDDN